MNNMPYTTIMLITCLHWSLDSNTPTRFTASVIIQLYDLSEFASNYLIIPFVRTQNIRNDNNNNICSELHEDCQLNPIIVVRVTASESCSKIHDQWCVKELIEDKKNHFTQKLRQVCQDQTCQASKTQIKLFRNNFIFLTQLQRDSYQLLGRS